MAILQLENGRTYTDFSNITRELAPLNIQLAHHSLKRNQNLRLLAQDVLGLTEKNQILQTVSSHFEEVRSASGYQWRDLMVLHPGAPHLYALTTHFNRCHTHADAEALYILFGEGISGFVRPDR